MQVLENKGICNAGDIWAKDGKYIVCPDKERIAELEKYTQSRKSKDKAYYKALDELRILMLDDLLWLTN